MEEKRSVQCLFIRYFGKISDGHVTHDREMRDLRWLLPPSPGRSPPPFPPAWFDRRRHCIRSYLTLLSGFQIPRFDMYVLVHLTIELPRELNPAFERLVPGQKITRIIDPVPQLSLTP